MKRLSLNTGLSYSIRGFSCVKGESFEVEDGLAEQLLATGRFDEQPVIANPAEESDTDNTGTGGEDEEPEAPKNGAGAGDEEPEAPKNGAGAGVEDGLTASKVSQMRNADLLALAEEKNISLEGCRKHDEYVERINGVLGLVDFSKLGLE